MPGQTTNDLLSAIVGQLSYIYDQSIHNGRLLEELASGNQQSSGEHQQAQSAPPQAQQNNEQVRQLMNGKAALKGNALTDPNTASTIQQLASGLKVLSAIDVIKLDKLSKTVAKLKVEDAQTLNSWMKALTKGMNKTTLNGLGTFASAVSALGILITMNFKKLHENLKALKLEDALTINAFILALVKGLPRKSADQIQSVTQLLNTISNMSFKGIIAMATLGKLVNGKLGQNIADFIKPIITIKEADPKILDGIAATAEAVGDILEKLTIAVAVGALIAKMDTKAAWQGVLLAASVAVIAVGIIYIISKIDGKAEISEGLDAIGDAVMKLSTVVGILTVIYKLGGDAAWQGVLLLSAISGVMVLTAITIRLAGSAIKDGLEGLQDIAQSVLIFSGALALLTIIGMMPNAAKTGLELMVGTVAIMISMAYMLSTKMIQEAMKTSYEALREMAITTTIMLGNVAALILLSQMAKLIDPAGLIIVVGLLAGLMFGMAKIGQIMQENGKGIGLAMLGLSAVLLSLSLSFTIITATVKKNKLPDILIGAALMVGFVLVMGLIVKLLNSIAGDSGQHTWKTILAISAMVLVIGFTIQQFLIPVGKKKQAAMDGVKVMGYVILEMVGLLVVAAVVQALTLGKAKNTLLSIVFSAVVLAMVIDFLLIPIGKQFGKAMLGMTALFAITLISVGVLYVLSKLNTNELKQAQQSLLMTTLCIGLLAFIANQFIIPIGRESIGDIMTGVLAVTAITGVAVVVAFALTQLPESKTIGIGTLALIGIAAAMGILALVTDKFVDVAKKVEGQSTDSIWTTFKLASAIISVGAAVVALAAWGASSGVGALAIAAGIAAMAGIIACMSFLLEIVEQYIAVADIIDQKRPGFILDSALNMSGLVASLMAVMGTLGAASGPMATFGILIMAATPSITAALNILTKTTALFSYVSEKMKQSEVDKALKLITGKGGVIETIKEIVKGFSSISPLKAGLGSVVSTIIMPMFSSIGKFIDVVIKLANMKYIEYWDENGKPHYGHIPEDAFVSAATMITDGFTYFISGINEAFSELDEGVAGTIFWLSGSFSPLVNALGKFTDIVIKMAQQKIISGYDDNGKPIYTDMPPARFAEAAANIVDAFGLFIDTLNQSFQEMDFMTANTIFFMEGSVGNLVESLSNFVDTVIKVSTLQFITGYDDKGHPIYHQVTENEFTNAGANVVGLFSAFISSLNTSFNSLNSDVLDTMDAFSDSIGPIMKMLTSYIDAVIKVSTLQVITGYDDKGKPIYKQVSPSDFNDAAKNVNEQFKLFIKNLGTGFADMKESTIDLISDMEGSFGSIAKLVSSYIDSVIKLSTFQIITGYDDRGKPIYDTSLTAERRVELFKDSAQQINVQFMNFIKNLGTGFASMNSDTVDTINKMAESFGPIAKLVSSYVDAVLNVANFFPVKEFDENGKPIYDTSVDAKKRKELFDNAGTTLSDSFKKFIDELGTEFATLKPDAVKVFETMGSALGPLMKGVNNYVDSIIALASAKQTFTGEDGKLHTKDFEVRDKEGNIFRGVAAFGKAGEILTDSLTAFLTTLQQQFQPGGIFQKDVSDTLKLFKNGFTELMDGIKPFVDSIMGIASGKFILGDEVIDFNPAALAAAGTTLGTAFSNFVEGIAKFGKTDGIKNTLSHVVRGTLTDTMGNLIRNAIQNLKGLGEVFDNLGQLIDLVIKISENTGSVKTGTAELTQQLTNLFTFFAKNVDTLKIDEDIADQLIDLAGVVGISGKLFKYITKTFDPEQTELMNGSVIMTKSFVGLLSELIKQLNGLPIESLQKFVTSFNALTSSLNTIVNTKYVKTINILTNSLLKLSNAFKKLDAELIKKEKQRNKSLQVLADKFKGISQDIQSVNKALEKNVELTNDRARMQISYTTSSTSGGTSIATNTPIGGGFVQTNVAPGPAVGGNRQAVAGAAPAMQQDPVGQAAAIIQQAIITALDEWVRKDYQVVFMQGSRQTWSGTAQHMPF